MTSGFKRGVDKERLLRKAHIFFRETDAGKAICKGVKAKVLYVCIRNNYFNVYRNGCALLKYSPNAAKHKFLVHKKYFPDGTPFEGESGKYASLNLDVNSDLTDVYINGIINNPNENLKAYLCDKNKNVDSEKELLQAYLVAAKPCLIDLEVTFSCKSTTKPDQTVAKRIDLAVLERSGDKIVLRFIEAKVVSDSRLKADKKVPEVIGQLKIYETFLRKESDYILESYRCIAKNYIEWFPYLLAGSKGSLMKEFLKNGDIVKKPSLLLLSRGDKSIEQSLQGINGRNSGNHYKTLMELCMDKWVINEWVLNE